MLNDPDTPTAYHESGHVVMALQLDWPIGDVSLRRCEVAPRDDAPDPFEAALVTVAGDAALWTMYERSADPLRKGEAYRTDAELARIADAVRPREFHKLANGRVRQDTAETIGWLLQATGGASNRELIRLYRGLEREARSVVKERWGQVQEIAHLLLKYGLLTPKQRRWLYY